ncbi:MAG: amidohydrolase family protein [Holophagaceae bacterium]|nr:amidohydrolase family protein [Holophagaceae bacterium]
MPNHSIKYKTQNISWFTLACLLSVIGLISACRLASSDKHFVPSNQVYDASKFYVYYNGKIYNEYVPLENKTGGGSYSLVSGMITQGQWVRWVGTANTEAQIRSAFEGENLSASNTVFINLKGATVLPGLIENHMHFVGQGELSLRIDCFWKPKQTIIAMVVEEAQRLNREWVSGGKTDPIPWVLSRGWLHTLGGDWDSHHPDTYLDWPTRWELDEPMSKAGVGHIPVFLRRADGHSAWVNTATLELAFAHQRYANKKDYWAKPVFQNSNGGNDIILNAEGTPIGILAGGNVRQELLDPVMPELTDVQLRFSIKAAESEALSYGLTSIMDAGASLRTVQFIEEAYENLADTLKLRIYQELSVEADGKFNNGNGFKAFPVRGHIPTAITGAPEHLHINRPAGITTIHGPRINDYDMRYTIRNVKFFIDGSLGSRTANLLKEYSDDHGNTGSPRTSARTAELLIAECIKYGFQNSAHCIGDAGNKMYLDAYEKVLNRIKNKQLIPSPTWGRLNDTFDYRPRLEHFQIVDQLEQDDIQRAIDLGMIPSMQTVHATSDMNVAKDRVGEERIKGAYAWRTILDKGGIIANGTDANVELLNPYHSLYAAVTRVGRNQNVPQGFKAEFIGGTKNFTVDSGWHPQQKLTRAEALVASTEWGAYAQFEEAYKGKLAVGYLADFVVIDRDFFDTNSCPDFDIKDINALMTVIGGEVVYSAMAPEIVNSSLQPAYIGTDYSTTVTANGTTGFVWSISRGSLPKGLLLNSSTGVISGKPSAKGAFGFTLVAKNALGTDSRKMTIDVN